MAKNQRNDLSELKNYISGLDFGHKNKSDILFKARIVSQQQQQPRKYGTK